MASQLLRGPSYHFVMKMIKVKVSKGLKRVASESASRVVARGGVWMQRVAVPKPVAIPPGSALRALQDETPRKAFCQE